MNFNDTKLKYHPLVVKAFDVAKQYHDGQMRGTTSGRSISYMQHPVKVAEILQDTIPDCPPELIAAGLTHDLIEDTDMTEERLRALLGEDVATLVKSVSIDPSIKGAARVEFQQKALSGESLNARRLKVADRLTNLLSLTYDPPAHWTVVNRYDYLEAGKKLIETAEIPDSDLKATAERILRLADRSVFLAVRNRVEEKGMGAKHWKHASPGLQSMMRQAADELERKKELFDEDGDPCQKTGDLEELYGHAAEAQEELTDVVKHVELFTGCEAVIPGLKEEGRARDSIARRCQGDNRGISDLARVALICDDMDQVGYVLHALSQSYRVAEIYDRFHNPPMTAYRDASLVVCSDQGHFCEIQVHLRHIWEAKKSKGDAIYSRIRDFGSGDSLTPEQRKERRKLMDTSRELYKEAAEKHGFTGHHPVAKVPPFRPTTEARLPPAFIQS